MYGIRYGDNHKVRIKSQPDYKMLTSLKKPMQSELIIRREELLESYELLAKCTLLSSSADDSQKKAVAKSPQEVHDTNWNNYSTATTTTATPSK